MLVRASVLAAAAGLVSTVSGHAMIRGVFVNGAEKPDGQNVYIRSPPNNSPVKALDTPALNCGVNGGKAAPQFVSAAAGDTITTEWFHNTRGDDIIDGSHKGPIITYIAKYTTGDGSGPIWSKIDESGLSADGTTWAVDTLIKNKGKYNFKLPSALAAGKYLVRQEIIAHHESDSPPTANGRGAQFYPSCIQFDVTGTGSAVPDQNFDFNKGYTAADPGIVFNLYGGAKTYAIPGPKVWTAAAGGNAPAPAPTTAPTAAPTPTQPGNGNGSVGTVAIYQQCGGKNYQGATACAQGTICKNWNEWYFQCIPN
ncbi:glycosyl hydrolase family 61-domain-containing protein [Microdochium bolleyi]|uniref:lytic cellulose monooxygenase (C4-dehydrogenating) n=1 Tax=Microdochium bolleyi TaxID=196109 RepID=A0A136JBV7_9PEZI|nr:glycosyl hydrolase family 61-domain-containing protein [Microdochium bolleyi]